MEDCFCIAGAVLARVVAHLFRERRPIAKELIDFDREFAAMLASVHGEGGKTDPAKTQSYFVRHGRYTAGTATITDPRFSPGKTDTSTSLKDFWWANVFILPRSSGSRMPSPCTSATLSVRMGAFASSPLAGRAIQRQWARPFTGCANF